MALGTPGDPAVTMTTSAMSIIALVVVTESRVRVITLGRLWGGLGAPGRRRI